MVWDALVSGAIDDLSERKEMKKSELKNIIKECVKEVIFEEGVLSGIITEVAVGIQGIATKPLVESVQSKPHQGSHNEAKKKVLDAVGQNSYADLKNKFSNPGLFEGTKPIPSGNGHGALSGVAPGDSGVDISRLPGMGDWATVAQGKKR